MGVCAVVPFDTVGVEGDAFGEVGFEGVDSNGHEAGKVGAVPSCGSGIGEVDDGHAGLPVAEEMLAWGRWRGADLPGNEKREMEESKRVEGAVASAVADWASSGCSLS